MIRSASSASKRHFLRGAGREVDDEDLLAFMGDEPGTISALHTRTTVAGCARNPSMKKPNTPKQAATSSAVDTGQPASAAN